MAPGALSLSGRYEIFQATESDLAIVGATIVHPERDAGMIAPGRLADLVVRYADPLPISAIRAASTAW